jgi:predicted nucleic acid-binding protein
VTDAVLDASVVLKWFRGEERHVSAARALRAAYEAGELVVLAPPLLRLEMLNVAGRWRWAEDALIDLAAALEEIGFALREPELARVAHWTARGLTAHDAAYVAVAEGEAVPLITDDELVLSVASDVATALGDVAADGR